MKAATLALAIALMTNSMHIAAQETPTTPTLAHVSNSFEFTLSAPFDRAGRLFGAEAERCWAGDHWDPHFLHPSPAQDVAGAVFTIARDGHTSVWVNTQFDLAVGRMQYVAFLPDLLVTTIDVTLIATSTAATDVKVTYTRTALTPQANTHVAALGEHDRASGPEWQQAIEECLKKPLSPATGSSRR